MNMYGKAFVLVKAWKDSEDIKTVRRRPQAKEQLVRIPMRLIR
jgi:hypothetical protein